jgi:serine/threonine protein kinase
VLKVLETNEESGFVHEWRLPTLLDLPNTLRPIDHYLSSSYGMVVFPFLESRPCNPKSGRTWLVVLQQLFHTLSVLHKNNYAHLDIKPSNILWQGSGRQSKIVLIDFGIVELIDEQCEESHSLSKFQEENPTGTSGTFPYIDPVYLETHRPSTQCDMWSVGILLAQSILQKSCFSSLLEQPPKILPTTFLEQSKAFPDSFKKIIQRSNSGETKERKMDKDLLFVTEHLLEVEQKKRWSSQIAFLKVSEIIKCKK